MKKLLAPLALALPLTMSLAGTAYAESDSMTLHANLAELNGSGASGMAMVKLDGTQVTVEINSTGLLPGQPHAQHFHIGGENRCPTQEDDTNGDGRISTPEGKPAYGGIKVSLTTEGDFSPKSALAVKRMPIANDDGEVHYSRTFEVSESVAAMLRAGKAVIVQHGVDYNGNGKYDFDSAGKSEIDPALPAEAVNPADCGRLTAAPEGGVRAGGGGTAGGTNGALAGLGGAFLAAAAGGMFVTRRARRHG